MKQEEQRTHVHDRLDSSCIRTINGRDLAAITH